MDSGKTATRTVLTHLRAVMLPVFAPLACGMDIRNNTMSKGGLAATSAFHHTAIFNATNSLRYFSTAQSTSCGNLLPCARLARPGCSIYRET